jgi:hypothetical protein
MTSREMQLRVERKQQIADVQVEFVEIKGKIFTFCIFRIEQMDRARRACGVLDLGNFIIIYMIMSSFSRKCQISLLTCTFALYKGFIDNVHFLFHDGEGMGTSFLQCLAFHFSFLGIDLRFTMNLQRRSHLDWLDFRPPSQLR